MFEDSACNLEQRASSKLFYIRDGLKESNRFYCYNVTHLEILAMSTDFNPTDFDEMISFVKYPSYDINFITLKTT